MSVYDFCEKIYDFYKKNLRFLKTRFLNPKIFAPAYGSNGKYWIWPAAGAKKLGLVTPYKGNPLDLARRRRDFFLDFVGNFPKIRRLLSTIFFPHRTRSTIFYVSTIFILSKTLIYEIVDSSCLRIFLSADRYSTNFLKITQNTS